MLDVDRSSFFWQYLSPGQRGLIEEGLYLISDIKENPDVNISDYSYLVFPFAKAYEGFLKKLFLDLGFIPKSEYESDYFRIGKALNPGLEKRFRYLSLYDKLVDRCGTRDLANELWSVWKRGRNLVFHYFPHNFRALSLSEAEEIVNDILTTMEKAVRICRIEENL